ncbi:MAG: hypothetical protein HUK18_00960, partial [Bacteroidales bacterium]|nr:hypothetical protein [Bacteroidales bacterium]
MDKKSIIGLVLICLVFVVFAMLNKPSKEQIAQQKHYQDSLAKVAQQKEAAKKNEATIDAEDEELQALKEQAESNDSVRNVLNNVIKDKYAVFSSSAMEEDKKILLENDVFVVELSNKGGMVKQVTLKDWDIYGGKEKVSFFTKDGNNYGLHLSVGKNIINTEDLYFKVFVNNKPYESNQSIKVSGKDSVQVSMRLYADASD